MAASSLLTLIDDIATILDDVAVMTKVAAKKTAGVLGDDLALNAQQVTGVKADRELPVVWAVAKGSAINKLILVPAALAISAVAPWAIIPLLMLGGAFLCYEGFHKIAHSWLHSKAEDRAHHQELVEAVANPAVDMVAFEREKVKGAVRTDFILSAEIVVISLGTVADAGFMRQVLVLCGISTIMTVGVYGLVAGIVKLDDLGLHLNQTASAAKRKLGQGILKFAPVLMKTLSIVGTAAMFMVGGGILVHGVPALHHGVEHVTEVVAAWPGVGGVLAALTPTLLSAIAGIVAGGLIVLVLTAGQKLFKRGKPAAA
jgi:predicted DNA repair protein MutK